MTSNPEQRTYLQPETSSVTRMTGDPTDRHPLERMFTPKTTGVLNRALRPTVDREVVPRLVEAIGQRLRAAAQAPTPRPTEPGLKGIWQSDFLRLGQGSADMMVGRSLPTPRDMSRDYQPASPPRDRGATNAVVAFTRLLTASDGEAAFAYVKARFAHGMDTASFATDLLGPAARRLGEMWLDDRCSFADVTIGVMRLKRIMRDLAPRSSGHRSVSGAPTGTLLLTTLPHEQHTLGMAVIEHCFRSAEWNVIAQERASHEALASLVRRDSVDVIAFAVSGRDDIDELRESIASLRAASCNPAIAVLVGGVGIHEASHGDPERACDLTGADGCAFSESEGLEKARAMLRTVLEKPLIRRISPS